MDGGSDGGISDGGADAGAADSGLGDGGSGVDAGTWSLLTPVSGETPWVMSGLTGSGIYAVGPNGWTGAWAQVPTTTSQQLLIAYGAGVNDVWFVGGGGTIVHCLASGCGVVTAPTTRGLYDVHGSGPNRIFAVGEAGTILR